MLDVALVVEIERGIVSGLVGMVSTVLAHGEPDRQYVRGFVASSRTVAAVWGLPWWRIREGVLVGMGEEQGHVARELLMAEVADG